MYRRILVPFDGSELAEAVVPHVRAFAECSGAEVVLLRVVEYPIAMYPAHGVYPSADPRLTAAVREKKDAVRLEAKDYLEHIAAHLGETGLRVMIEVREEPVVDGILDTAESLGADLIAMSTHGCGGFAHRFMGAVADRVVHSAKVPVLLIQPAPIESSVSLSDPWEAILT